MNNVNVKNNSSLSCDIIVVRRNMVFKKDLTHLFNISIQERDKRIIKIISRVYFVIDN